MKNIWHPGNPICIHPGGVPLIGIDAVLNSWNSIFTGTYSPTLKVESIKSFISLNLEVRIVKELITPHTNSTAKASIVIATNSFLITDDGWKIVAHHASLPLIEIQNTKQTLH